MRTLLTFCLRWLPRVAGICLALVIFAMEFGATAHGDPLNPWPPIVLLAVLIVAWRYKKIGGIAYLAAAIISIVVFSVTSGFSPFLLVAHLPLFIIGLLFWMGASRSATGIKTDTEHA